MPYIDNEIYDTLVNEKGNEDLLENLLAYHYYQEAKIKAVTRYYNRYGTVPSDEFIHDILGSYEAISGYKSNAKAKLPEHILSGVKISSKKDGWLGTFIDRTLSSLAARIAFEFLTLIVLYLIGRWGLDKYWPVIKVKLGL